MEDSLCRQAVSREPEEPPVGFWETASGIAFLLGLGQVADLGSEQRSRDSFPFYLVCALNRICALGLSVVWTVGC